MTLVAMACGHSDPPAASGTTAPGGTETTTAAADTAAPGDFGTLKGVCGPGEAKSIKGRGITDDAIQIGVLNDATASLAPGLGAIYLDTAKAFTDWCNEAGGINGRKITWVGRDAQITQAAARITDACQSDFMLVGGATPFDANTVEPRLACELGAIPSYAASPEATQSKLQALPTRVPATEANLGLERLLEDQYGDAFKKIGVLAVDTPSLLAPTQVFASALDKAGYEVTSFQKIPLTVDNWRTFVQPLVGKVDALAVPSADATGLFRAMNDVGYVPDVMVASNGYSEGLITSLKATPIEAPLYLSTNLFPLELADQNPAVKLALELTEEQGSKYPVDAGAIPSWESWVLFAQAATACGDDLTVDCVIEKATTQTDYDAGGLMAPVDLTDPTAISPCVAILTADAEGFHYDEKLTKPTDGVFNCDPKNITKVR
ncbi:hypothetical protein BH10ACT1_BH10ACT1_17060 [soil metagenome]